MCSCIFSYVYDHNYYNVHVFGVMDCLCILQAVVPVQHTNPCVPDVMIRETEDSSQINDGKCLFVICALCMYVNTFLFTN